jgi:hypothetical protein
VSFPRFTFTERAYPVVQIGVGDIRTPTPLAAVWDQSLWDDAGGHWAGTEPEWLDVSCEAFSCEMAYGRVRTSDRYVPGYASLFMRNESGWADPLGTSGFALLSMRPGRAIRIGVIHQDYGPRWLFRGFIDSVEPSYDPSTQDTVTLNCLDALGEVNRGKIPGTIGLVPAETADARINRILDLVLWPAPKRDIPTSTWQLIESEPSGQVADLLGQAAGSVGGVVFGDTNANVTFRPLDWQTYLIGTPPDGTIGNLAPDDVCPVVWRRPFDRADITTRVIMGRDADTAITLDDDIGMALYGMEPFERVNLLTADDGLLLDLATRTLETRSFTTAPRVRAVQLNARTADNALDLMATVDIYKPSRYRCRLVLDRGVVFNDDYFATAVTHRLTASSWELEMNLDLSLPFALTVEGWDGDRWDRALWSAPLQEEMV